ncbi:hypothetical protein ACT6NV_10205 [Robiginitalea sp. IMCC44478]|uniref:hypothetical protein n=1 Tax=Robiginitalea sp. IMCC44478 TaxID=3459122 RepID=UPI004041D948
MASKKLQNYIIELDPNLFACHQFGVSAYHEEEALQLIWTQVFHNQTIPADYTILNATDKEINKLGFTMYGKSHKEPVIWFPEKYITVDKTN